MPTPVSSARQCLTDEAARALDDAVAVARRRSHSQTTSLHAVSALLSLPTSTLRDACARARSSAYSHRLQFRALELCVSVSLDRLPSAKSKTLDDEPPVSNSLMAAIKRSQANQRRHPETFHLYQMHNQLHASQSSSSLSCVKVELKHFILSILDDPIVSRVFGDAGFRSTDIKITILHPPTPISGFHKSLRYPPLFLCNLPDPNSNINRTGFNFPFAVDQGEEDYKRIGQILAKKTSNNPLLIGISADSVLTGFTDSIKTGKNRFLPTEIQGFNIIDVDNGIREFVSGNSSEEMMNLKIKEVREKVETCTNCGLIVNYGELKLSIDVESTEFIVSQLSNLVETYGGKLRLIGSVSSYEIYMKIVSKSKNLEKDWDLNLIPITCSKLNTTNGSPQFKSSLMGSFVPFGGFFPVSTEMANSSSKNEQIFTRCDRCNEKYEHEVLVLKGGKTMSVSDQQSTSLASWLHNPESGTNLESNVLEDANNGGMVNARVNGLQRKWNDICHRLHHNPPQNSSQIRAQIPFPHHFQPNTMMAQINGQDSNQETISRTRCQPVDFSKSTSSSPATSITTDLGLGTIYISPYIDPKPRGNETRFQSIHGSGYTGIDDTGKQDFKQLYRALVDEVGYQNESIRAISQTITRVRTGNERRHLWLMFCGSDRVGKKKISTALAEVVFGSRESLISIDLNFENQIRHSGSMFDRQSVDFSDPCFRGKTVTDVIAEELTKKPRSIVFLEHIDKADFLTKDCLSRAVKNGKISDTRGRETRITDAIFITTISCSSEDTKESDDLNYSEERILNAKALQMRISVEINEPASSSFLISPKDSISRNPESSKKRKIIEINDFTITVPKVKKVKSCFDLNLPLEENEESDNDNDNDTVSDTKESWLEEFVEQVDEKVVFEPYDFDSCAENISKQIGKCFQKSFGTNVVLEIDNEVMVPLLASYWLSDRNGSVEKWIDSVLYNGFVEIKEKKRVVGSESMVKLVVVEGATIEDNDVSCVCLPSTIMVK